MLKRFMALLALCCVVGVAAAGTTESLPSTKPWPDPGRYEKKITEYEAITTAPQGAILAYGSSSIVGWHKWIHEDLKPLTIVPRGFGGSNMNDAVHFMDRAVISAKPRAVLLYEGDNDVAGGHPTERILGKYREFIERLRAALPETRVYIISVKPSIRRWAMWPQMQEVNTELRKLGAAEPNVEYIDVATPMLNEKGEPRADIFLKDDLHMNRAGYDIWRDTVRAAIMEREQKEEKDS